jgi:hypothetical protein
VKYEPTGEAMSTYRYSARAHPRKTSLAYMNGRR